MKELLFSSDEEFSSDRMEIRYTIINKRSKIFYALNEGCIYILLLKDLLVLKGQV